MHQNRPYHTEMFNYKDKEGQEKFLHITTNTNKLSNCFNNNLNIKHQSMKFEKALTKLSHECFTKIRVGQKTFRLL